MKDKGFRIPEDYFEQKKLALKQIANAEKAEHSSKVPSHGQLYFIAAAAALVCLGLFVFYPSSEIAPSNITFSELRDQEVIHFLSEDPNGIYPESFFELPSNPLDTINNLDPELIDAYLDEAYLPIEFL